MAIEGVLTGGTGLFGSGFARALLADGHTVLGLARSDASADQLASQGVAAIRGDLGAPPRSPKARTVLMR